MHAISTCTTNSYSVLDENTNPPTIFRLLRVVPIGNPKKAASSSFMEFAAYHESQKFLEVRRETLRS